MNDTLWRDTLVATKDTDRREQHAIRLTALVVIGLLLLGVLADQFGILRPGLRFTGNAGAATANGPVPTGTAYLDVTSRSLIGDRVTSASLDYPGVTITDARLEPGVQGLGDSDQLALDFQIDCTATDANGSPAWTIAPLPDTAPLRVTVDRPWGSASLVDERAGGIVLSLLGDACNHDG